MLDFNLFPSLDIVEDKALTSRSAIDFAMNKNSIKDIIGDPLDVVDYYFESGAKWVHIVDLDAASGIGNNINLIIKTIKHIDSKMNTQICGGIRSKYNLEKYIDAGCSRVNISSMIFEQPLLCDELFKKHRDKIAVALDVSHKNSKYKLATRGWNRLQGDLWNVIEWLDKSGCPRYVVTDIERGGMMNHPNFTLLEQVIAKTQTPIVSGGGVTSEQDITRLKHLGTEGSVLGQVIHTQRHQLERFIQYAQKLNKNEPVQSRFI